MLFRSQPMLVYDYPADEGNSDGYAVSLSPQFLYASRVPLSGKQVNYQRSWLSYSGEKPVPAETDRLPGDVRRVLSPSALRQRELT